MKYKQLNIKIKDRIDISLSIGYSMRQVGRELNTSHSTISRYKINHYKKRKIDIPHKYNHLIDYLNSRYDFKVRSIDVCLNDYKWYHLHKPCVSVQQVYNWINQGKLTIDPLKMCYKRRKRKRRMSRMMNHFQWNFKIELCYQLV